MNEQNNPILEVKNLRVSYHTYAGEVKAVRGVQFSLEKGQALAIVGESGCGKSVTAKSIMASSRPRRVRLKRTVKFSIMERIF
mgnify:CR=1 FL=1